MKYSKMKREWKKWLPEEAPDWWVEQEAMRAHLLAGSHKDHYEDRLVFRGGRWVWVKPPKKLG